MKTVVVKFGGTSVADERARACAIQRIGEYRQAGCAVVAVVSAMGRKGAPYATDTLLSLVRPDAAPEIRDLIMTCGESISACVFADALCQAGIDAVAMNGMTAGIRTDSVHLNAEIVGMDTERVNAALAAGKTVVITGFQGVAEDMSFHTLGRGGSDTSAAAIAGYLRAERCVIYTDVPGVAECDPRIVPEARFMDRVDAEDMLELARRGAGVIHPRAVAAALASGTPLRVASTFRSDGGTDIVPEAKRDGFVGLAVAHDGTDDLVTMLYHPVERVLAQAQSMFPACTREGDLITVRLPAGGAARTAAQALYAAFAVNGAER